MDRWTYRPELDGLRSVAVYLVLLFHCGLAAFTGGFVGVDLFFVLSGFLITGILYDSRAEAAYFRRFYMRRALRIFPLYYAVLAVVFFVLPLIPALRDSEIAALRAHQGWAWLYGINVYLAREGGWVLSYVEHFWSLAVEEHFYLVWPLIVWWLAPRPRVLMRTALAICLASLLARVVATLAGVNPVAITVLTPFQLDALCLGGFFAVALRQPGGVDAVRRWLAPMALLAGACLFGDFLVHRLTGLALPWTRAIRGGVFRVLFAALLLQAVLGPAASGLGRFLRSGPMTALGRYSYGLYVYHHFLSYYFVTHGTEFALARALGSHALAVVVQAAAGIVLSLAVAWASYEHFEKHFLGLKRFWPASGRRTTVPRREVVNACA